MKADNGPHIRAIDAPESWAEVPDDRVTCGGCIARSGFMCIPLKMSALPPELKHRCPTFVPRGGLHGR